MRFVRELIQQRIAVHAPMEDCMAARTFLDGPYAFSFLSKRTRPSSCVNRVGSNMATLERPINRALCGYAGCRSGRLLSEEIPCAMQSFVFP